MTHQEAYYDLDTKTLYVTTKSDRRDPDHQTKFWAVDPQLQIINLLKEQLALLKQLVDHSAPYHTGSQTVDIAPVPPADASDPPLPPPPEEPYEESF